MMIGSKLNQEFLKITKILSNSTKYNFSIVCPSIPGFGFSGKPDKKGFNSEKIAHIWHELMLELGYKKYIVQGGDWGATISKWIAELYPDLKKFIIVPASLRENFKSINDIITELKRTFKKDIEPIENKISSSEVEIVEILISKGAGVNQLTKYGESPLDKAVENEATEAINLLRKHGSKPSETHYLRL